MTTPRTPTAQTVDDLLENGHEEAARQTLRAIARELQSGIVNRRLNELETEAVRLEAVGERLRPDNPVLLQTLRDMDAFMGRNQQRIRDVAPDLTEAGVGAGNDISRLLTFAGMSDNTSASIGAQWNRPDPNAVAALVDFTQDNAFDDLLSQYGSRVVDRIGLRATFGFTEGWGARRSARAIRRLAIGMPMSEAETLTRTLHLVSYRRGTAATHAANAHILQETAIRVAVLDPRTCLTCIALHGDPVPLGEPVADHYNGRCTVIAQVRGFNRNIMSGADWFNQLPPERQQQQRAFVNSPGSYAAFADGAVGLRDFVGERTDPVFGEQVYQASLVGILGDDARRYYRR